MGRIGTVVLIQPEWGEFGHISEFVQDFETTFCISTKVDCNTTRSKQGRIHGSISHLWVGG